MHTDEDWMKLAIAEANMGLREAGGAEELSGARTVEGNVNDRRDAAGTRCQDYHAVA